MGDLGGVLELIIVTVGFLVAPFAKHSFTLAASKKLFFGRTNDEDIFTSKPDKRIAEFCKSDQLSEQEKREVKIHRNINVSSWQAFKLYIGKMTECIMFKTFE